VQIGLGELVVGPFKGLAVYPRAAKVAPSVALALLVVTTLVCAGALSARWHQVRSGWLDDAAESPLYLMPRVTIEGGEARSSAPPRLYDAVHFLVWLDPSTDAPRDVPLEPGETRPVVHIGKTALIVVRRGGSPRPLPWAIVEDRFGPMSMDGTEVIRFLREQLPGKAMERMLFGSAVAVVYQVLLAALLAWFYRVLFWRGLYVPRFGTLVTIAAVAALPPTVLAAVVGLAGLGQGAMVTAHGLGVGLLFLAGATRVRLGDEQPDAPPAEAEPPSPPEADPDPPTDPEPESDDGEQEPS